MYRVWDDRNRELLIKTVTTWSNWTLIESWPGSILNFVTRRDSENWKLETCSYTNSMRWFWFSHREGSKTPPSLTSKSLGQDFGQDSEKKLWLGPKCPDSWPGQATINAVSSSTRLVHLRFRSIWGYSLVDLCARFFSWWVTYDSCW